MIFKKDKEAVLNDIRIAAMNATYRCIYNNAQLNVDASPIVHMLQEAISRAVEAGFKTLIESQYTDEDFERDITLR